MAAADLHGYGNSGKPPGGRNHAAYATSALARDQVPVMRQPGFGQSHGPGHDRGARRAYRRALDHPERPRTLAVLDIVSTGAAFRRMDMAFVLDFWRWPFLAAPFDVPERLIAANPDVHVDYLLEQRAVNQDAFPAEIREAHHPAFRDPAAIHASREQDRAAVTIDFQQDETDRGQRRIACPALVLRSKQGALEAWCDVLNLWRQWADDGGAVRSIAVTSCRRKCWTKPIASCRHFSGTTGPNADRSIRSAFPRFPAGVRGTKLAIGLVMREF